MYERIVRPMCLSDSSAGVGGWMKMSWRRVPACPCVLIKRLGVADRRPLQRRPKKGTGSGSPQQKAGAFRPCTTRQRHPRHRRSDHSIAKISTRSPVACLQDYSVHSIGKVVVANSSHLIFLGIARKTWVSSSLVHRLHTSPLLLPKALPQTSQTSVAAHHPLWRPG